MEPKDLNFYRPGKRWLRPRYFLMGMFILFFWFLVWAQSNSAKELTIINEPYESVAPVNLLPQFTPTPQRGQAPMVQLGKASPRLVWGFTLVDKVREGMDLLNKSAPLKYETRGRRSSGELVRKQIALAILNKETGEVREHRVWVKEGEIKNYRQTGIINLESDSDLEVAVNWWNSFNTDYGFPDNHNLVVVANKYLWLSSNLNTLPERSKNKYTEIVYAPYSKGLHAPELVEAGKKYIEENIDLAFNQLESDRVTSRYVVGQPVVNGIDKDFIKSIIVVEHIDPDAFKVATDDGKELSERVLVIMGANREKAYRYTGSPAGASGLAQFIRPTYLDIASKYPKAKMIKDYTLGMANHINAVKAMVLFFDEHKKSLASRITRKDIVQPLGITEEMLAAAYNGGPSRVARSVNKFGLAWIGSQLRLSSSGKILRNETLNYVEKFQSIKKLNIF